MIPTYERKTKKDPTTKTQHLFMSFFEKLNHFLIHLLHTNLKM